MDNKANMGNIQESLRLDQLLTKRDLLQFREELFKKLESLLPGISNEQKKQWLKSAEVRKLLNISPGTLQTLRINGVLPYTKVGGSMYYKSSDIERVLELGNRNDESPLSNRK